MALVDHRPRTATVVADTDLDLLRFDSAAFAKLLEDADDALDRADLAIARDEDDYVPWDLVKADLGLT